MLKRWLPLWITAAVLTAFSTEPLWSQAIQGTLVNFGGTAQPVTLTGTNALPSDAATATAQTTGNNSLSAISTTEGGTGDTAATNGGTGSNAAKLRNISSNTGTIGTNTTTMASACTSGSPGTCHVTVDNILVGIFKAGGTSSAMTGTTSTQVIAAQASNYLYVTSCSANNTHASVDTLVDLQDGSGGTVLWVLSASHGYNGESHTFGSAPLKVPTLGNGLYAVNETTGASVKVYCNGYYSTNSY